MSHYPPPQPLPPQRPKKKAGKIAGFSCLGILGVFIFFAILGNIIGDDTQETAKPAATPTATSSPDPEPSLPAPEESEPQKTPEPSETPQQEPTKKPDPEKQLAASIKKALGKSNRDAERFGGIDYNRDGATEITLAANNNLTENFIKTAARRDVVTVIDEVKKSKLAVTNVVISVTFLMTDAYGNSEESQVMRLGYSADVIDRINTGAVDREKIEHLADGANLVVPAFRY
ncbi:procyclic acidic repetitive family protein [Streptomyces sp. 549]|uniref:procyclic acidic repetitive family protein n=1 Tax=Streptomyces sp. 549 TaxID=3049076 RepID=UPI0024C36AB9|nr:procyclic acidic repetitive family protein [Streptomyces sp. 549]MDK1473625.1 procyclic acidic repetitive family protein [Streptomyces sp. 549]